MTVYDEITEAQAAQGARDDAEANAEANFRSLCENIPADTSSEVSA